MKRIPLVLLGLGALALGAAVPGSAQTAKPGAKPWIHVQVEEANGSKVNVNLPLSLVQIGLKAAPDPVIGHGHIRLGNHSDLKVADLRKLWAELKATGDADLVSVEDEGETVSVKRQGDLVLVRVDNPGKKEQVRVDVPLALVDALLASDGETLNLDAALAELAKRRGDIVTVNDGGDKVRVWIDERL
jgi:hypothetical protein